MDSSITECYLAKKLSTNKKVPGEVAPLGRLEDEAKKFQKEIKTKTIPELKDLLERQSRILQNKKLVTTLPDKGSKVRQRQQQLMVSTSMIMAFLCLTVIWVLLKINTSM